MASERICDSLQGTLKIADFSVRWFHVLDDVYVPRKLLHLLSKIDRCHKAFCAEMFGKLFSRTLNRKYHTEVDMPRYREIIALFFQS